MQDHVRIQLSEAGADAEHLDTVTGYLRQELFALDDAVVTPLPAGPAPPGTRAVDLVAVGGLLVSLLSSEALSSVVAAVRRWLARGGPATRTVHVEIDGDVLELSAASTADQDRLIAMFVSRHGAATGPS